MLNLLLLAAYLPDLYEPLDKLKQPAFFLQQLVLFQHLIEHLLDSTMLVIHMLFSPDWVTSQLN